MRKGLVQITAGIALAGMISSSAYAAGCDDSRDKAAHVRSLQTELMVAALTCGAKAHYNTFVTKFQNVLIVNGQALKKQFRVMHGAKADRELNAYVTALANRASQRSINKRDNYCSRAQRTFATVTAMSPKELASFAMQRLTGDVDVPSSCRANVVMVDKTNKTN